MWIDGIAVRSIQWKTTMVTLSRFVLK